MAAHREWLAEYDRDIDPRRPTQARPLPALRLAERLDRLPDPDDRVRALLSAYDALVVRLATTAATYAPDDAIVHLLDADGLGGLPRARHRRPTPRARGVPTGSRGGRGSAEGRPDGGG